VRRGKNRFWEKRVKHSVTAILNLESAGEAGRTDLNIRKGERGNKT